MNNIEDLKIYVRDLNEKDISERKLPKGTSGVVVVKILEDSPLMFVSVNDIIVLDKYKNSIKNIKKDGLMYRITISTLLIECLNWNNVSPYSGEAIFVYF